LAGARASSRFAIGEGAAVVVAGTKEDLVTRGIAVIVCDVEVIEEVVLPVLAIVAFHAAVVCEPPQKFFTIRFTQDKNLIVT